MPDQALKGYRVLDLSHNIAGPYCTKLLAGLGAEVVKVERPGNGDPARSMGPFYRDDPHPEKSILFLYLNTSKKGITLDITTEMGKSIFKELVKHSAVVVESFEPGDMERLGLGYETLERINPGLVMTSLSNFGQTGPYRDYKALDINIMAMAGPMASMGEPDREPLVYGGWPAQYYGGVNGFAATLIALYYREVSGEGQHVDISLLECMSTLMEHSEIGWGFNEVSAPRWGNAWLNLAAWGTYMCQDGHIGVVSSLSSKRWRTLHLVMDKPELDDPRFWNLFGRRIFKDEIEAHMLPWLLEHTKEEIYHKGQKVGFPMSPIRTPEDIVGSAQLEARDFFVEVDHPVVGSFRYPGAPIRMTETPWQSGPAPLLGEHNEEVYCKRLGYTREQYVRLKEMHVI